MRTSEVIGTWLAAVAVLAWLVVGIKYMDQHHSTARGPNPPDTAGFWQQVNSATEQNCRASVLVQVLRMQLPESAYSDPALAKAMQEGYELCLMKNKVMI